MRRLLMTLLAAAVLAAAGPLAPDKAHAIPSPPDFTRNGALHTQALESLKKSDYGKVVELETKLVGEDPGDLTARYILAIAYLGLDKEKEAVSQAQKALKADPAFAGEIYGAMGRYYITKRRFHKALTYLQHSLELKEDPAVIKHIATIYLGQGLLGNAKAYLEKLLPTEPDYLNLSRIYLAEADFQNAERFAKEALKADNRATGAYLVLGTASLLTGKTGEAYSNFLILKQTNPEFFLTSYFIGLIKTLQKDYEGAHENFQSLINLAPGIKEGYLSAAVALHLKGDLEGAAQMASKAVEKDPLDPAARLALGNVFSSLKDFKAARAEYMKSADLFPDFALTTFDPEEDFRKGEEAAALTLAVLLNRAGLYGETSSLVTSSGSSNPFLRASYARALEKLGKKEAAEKEYRAILSASPGLATAHAGLGELYEGMEKPAQAAEAYLAAAEKTPGVKLRLKLAELYTSSGEIDKAADEYRRVITEAPELAPAYNRLARLLFEKKRDAKGALKYALKGSAVNPEDNDMKDTLGSIYLSTGQYEKALAAYSGIINGGSTNPAAYYRLGLVYKKLGRGADAAGAFEKALNINDEFPESSEAKKHLRELSGVG
jgi:tetratricopeptide (TPR) repeat protein